MIITRTKTAIPNNAFLNIYPDQFKKDSEKLGDPDWIKNTMDYFSNVAYAQFRKNKEEFSKNYDLLKGTITMEHFYQEPEVKDFMDTFLESEPLPSHIKNYSILNPPINTMIGELSKRPDVHRVRAYDDDSQSEELKYKTELVHSFILQQAQQEIYEKLKSQGQEVEDEELQQMTLDSVKNQLLSYTSLAEKWGNHTLTALKAFFNTKEKSEDAFRDLLIANREYFGVYQNNSKLGFYTRVENPKNVWKLTTPDNKYSSAVSGEYNSCYAIGTVYAKEMSEIIEEFDWLTKEEIDHLRSSLQDFGLLNVRESNLFTNSTGPESVKYEPYDPAVLQERMMVEASLKENNDELRDWLGLSNSVSAFGYKYAVVKSYHYSKKLIGKLTYIDEDGLPQIKLVDEKYKKIPEQLSIEWGWVNQIYEGTRIGPDIYHMREFKLLPYLPIIGVIHEIKNTTKQKSLLDLMKPYQVLFNICYNQIFELLEKEYGNVGIFNIRRVSRPKDGNNEDALDVLEANMKERGVAFDDDSPENTKGPTQNTSIARNVDLTRTNEIQSRYNLAAQIKDMCYELVGMNRQRMGGALATETATANQNALVQSFAQTEPYFATHTYVLNQWYQALLDAAQYTQSQNEVSTINYLSNIGESTFIQVQGSEIRNKALWVMVTSRPEDNQLYQEFKQLAQTAIQNGASLYEVSQMYTDNSIRSIQNNLKDLKDKQDQQLAQEQQLRQQELEQQQQEAQALLEQQERHHQDTLDMKKYEIDTRANTELGKAQIQNYFKVPETDANNNNIPDAMEIANHTLKLQESLAKRDIEQQNINLQYQKLKQDREEKAKDRELQKEKIKSDKQKAKQKPKK